MSDLIDFLLGLAMVIVIGLFAYWYCTDFTNTYSHAVNNTFHEENR